MEKIIENIEEEIVIPTIIEPNIEKIEIKTKPKIKESIEEIKQKQPIIAYIMEKFDAKIINKE